MEDPTTLKPTSYRRRRSGHLTSYSKRVHPLATVAVDAGLDLEASQPAVRVRIAYEDDAVYTSVLANMYRLLRAARQDDDPPASTSALLAKKALQYRNILERAQAVDVDDPAFDVAGFMGVTWSKGVAIR